MSPTKEKKLSQNQVEIIREHGLLTEDQIQQWIGLDLISGKKRTRGRRMMKMDDGRYVQPILYFCGKGKGSTYSESMLRMKEDFDGLLDKYTELVEV